MCHRRLRLSGLIGTLEHMFDHPSDPPPDPGDDLPVEASRVEAWAPRVAE